MGARLSVLRNAKSSRADARASADQDDSSPSSLTSEDAYDLKTLVEKDDVDAVRLLLDQGACISTVDAQGSSVLAYAVSREMTRLLIQRGSVDVNAVDSNLWTPLHVATVYNRGPVVQELLVAGAFVNAQTNAGQTPMLLAAWRGYEGIVRALIGYGSLLELVDAYNWTALVYAADNGHLSIVQLLLQAGAVVDTPSGEDDQTALMRAAWRGHEEIVRALISQGASVNLTNQAQWTPLLFAAERAQLNIIMCLLESGAFVDAQSDQGETALVFSSWNGQIEIVRELLKHGASLDLQTSARRTALMGAAENGHHEVVALLLECGAAKDLQSETGATALMLAAWNGHDDVVRVLIDYGSSVELMDEEHWTPLIYALDGSHQSTVQLLLDSGASVNVQCCDGLTPLMFATKNECGKIILRTLINAGASIDAVNAKQWTSLMFAVANEDLEAVPVLLECGANADLQSNRGQTALMLAAGKGYTAIVHELVAHGASLEIVDNTNRTALMFSAAHGHTSTVQLLIESGASIDRKLADDETPFFRAAWNGHEEVVRELLAHGASFQSVDKHGHTALIVSAAKGHLTIVKLLLEIGLSVDSQSDDGETALMRAAWGGYIDIVRELLVRGASLKLVDNEDRSVLMYGAENGHKEVVQLLLDHGVPVDYETGLGETALLRAAANGQEEMIDLLYANGADLNRKDSSHRSALIYAASKGQTNIVHRLIMSAVAIDQVDKKNLSALMYATAQGHHDTFCLLRECGASLDIISEDEETVTMLAIESGEKNIVYDLLRLKDCMEETVRYLQIGMLLPDTQDHQDTPVNVSATSADIALVEMLCLTMHEAQSMCYHVHQRLADINSQLEAMNKVVYKPLVERFKVILDHFYGFMLKHGNKLTVSRLVSHKVIFETCFDVHAQLDELWTTPGLVIIPKVHDWKNFWEDDVKTQRAFFNDAIKLKRMVADELADPEAQKEALTLLLFEHDKCESQYTEEETEWIHHIFHHVSSISSLKIEAVPSWFIPPHSIEFNVNSSFARGSYGSIHTGYWNSAVVVVKQAFLQDKESRDLFMNEAEIWYKLQHPNVVQLFRACHVGNPFFVCEYASNGTISDYLYRQKSDAETWLKLHQAAVGLLYIHSRHVVHGDLKCNNILVGDDLKAKMTDFGLSFVLKDDDSDDQIDLSAVEVGAIRWKAPEVIQCKTRGSFASDVYSFGMCIIEAVTGCLPWGNMPDVAVKHKLLEKRELPKQPQCMNEKQWSLIVKMCAWNPLDRLRMEEVESTLKELASKAKQ